MYVVESPVVVLLLHAINQPTNHPNNNHRSLNHQTPTNVSMCMWCVFPAYYFIWGVSHLVSCGLFCFVFWFFLDWNVYYVLGLKFFFSNSYFDTNDDDTYTHVLFFILFFMNEFKKHWFLDFCSFVHIVNRNIPTL